MRCIGTLATMTDFANHSNKPYSHYKAVVLDTPTPEVARGISVGVAGNVTLVGVDDHAETFTFPAGVWPVMFKQVNTTGTTASSLIALF